MKLTIYIPTYQRDELDACLASITSQINNDIQIIVSDNDGYGASICNNYKDFISSYQKRHFNINGDANVLRGLSDGHGEYIWVFGDDDVMHPGVIDKVMPLLNGVDRIIHHTKKFKEPSAGFCGSMKDYIENNNSKDLLVASTLVTANIWRRDVMNIGRGLFNLDTRLPLFWAGLDCKTLKIMDEPSFDVNVSNAGIHEWSWFDISISKYLSSLALTNQTYLIQSNGYRNFVSAESESI